jgi:DNA-binding LacI/PurR family transcriptional regulator
VGVGTVSRVINGSASVSEATRRRVLEVVAELGYEPNATARALSTGRTRSVGVIAPFFTRPSVIERLRGVAPMLAASGYQLVLFDVERPEQRTGVFRSLIGRVDGLLSISLAPPKAELRRLAAAGIPVVLVDQSHEEVPTVTVGVREGARVDLVQDAVAPPRRGSHGAPGYAPARVRPVDTVARAVIGWKRFHEGELEG